MSVIRVRAPTHRSWMGVRVGTNMVAAVAPFRLTITRTASDSLKPVR